MSKQKNKQQLISETKLNRKYPTKWKVVESECNIEDECNCFDIGDLEDNYNGAKGWEIYEELRKEKKIYITNKLKKDETY